MKGLGAAACVAATLALAVSCAAPSKPPETLRLQATQVGPHTEITLQAAPGLKLNARLKPALELTDGRVLRFDSPRLTPDSAYFAEPPSALVSGQLTGVHGKLRASVCDTGETVCRIVVVDL